MAEKGTSGGFMANCRSVPRLAQCVIGPGGSMAVNRYDAIIIGGGHNGLVCGTYLAKAGLKVLVLERRHIFGGAAVTEEIAPGFRASIFSYVMSILHPRIIADLEAAQVRAGGAAGQRPVHSAL